MAGLWISRPTQRPAAGARINWAHPLTVGLGDYWDWGLGDTYNLAYPQDATFPGTTRPALRGDGFYISNGDGVQYARHDRAYGVGADLSLLLEMTWVSSDSTYSCVLAAGGAGGNLALYLNTSGEIRFFTLAGSNADALNRPAFTANVRRQLVITRQSSTVQAYVDGATSGASWTNSGNSDNGYTSIGFRQVDNARIVGTYHRAAIWHRALSADEIRDLAAEPYALLTR